MSANGGIGARYGRLVVTGDAPRRNKKRFCRYVCDCGKEIEANYDNVRRGKQSSCGCLKTEVLRALRRTHGGARTPEYSSWLSARERCNNTQASSYKNYGARGITFCERWASFENFLSDMGARPKGSSLDRIDVQKGYSPENCRWATIAEQATNKRDNHRITAFGETLTISQWSRRYGVYVTTIRERILKGCAPEDAVSRPTRRNLHKTPPDSWGFYANCFGA